MFIFLYGADIFRSSEKFSDLKNKYLEKNGSGTDLSLLDFGSGATLSSFKEALSAQGLFSTKKFIGIQNAISDNSPEKQKELLTVLKSKAELEKDEDAVLVFFENNSPKKNGALYKFLFSHAKKQEFAPLEGAKLSAWVLDYAKKINPDFSFPNDALNLLLASTGNDLFLLSNEITKLINYAPANQASRKDVELLVKSKIDSTMFETIEALASGNKQKALKLLHEQIAKGEDIYYILSMYTYQLRTLLKIGDLYWQGMTSAPQIAQASGIHPYVVQKSLSQLRNISENKTRAMFSALAKIDQDAKTGKTNPLLALDTFIVSL